MISAKVFSVRRKYQIPDRHKTDVMSVEAINAGPISGDCPRNNAQRKPSITPTIGLHEYINRQFSGTILLLKPTGET